MCITFQLKHDLSQAGVVSIAGAILIQQLHIYSKSSRGRIHNTFFSLQPMNGPISLRVCSWQAFLA